MAAAYPALISVCAELSQGSCARTTSAGLNLRIRGAVPLVNMAPFKKWP